MLDGTQGPVPPKNNCNISYLDRGKEQEAGKLPVSPQNNCKTSFLDSAQSDPEGKEKERCKLTVPTDIIVVLDHKQELWESPVQESRGSNHNISPVLGKKRDCKTLYLDSAQGDDIRRPVIISI